MTTTFPAQADAGGPALPDAARAALEARLRDGTLDLPILPQVASRILAGGFDDAAEVGPIAALLERDPALTGHVLRVANSPAYSRGAPIQSIQQALIRIGLAQLREIVVAVALKSRVFRVQGFEAAVGALWKHAAVTGAYAKEIARMRRASVESAFLCGLLHDVGKPVVLGVLQEIRVSGGGRLSAHACLEALAPYHTRVGANLAAVWNLPGAVVESIAHHHDFRAAQSHAQAVMITSLADLLAHIVLSDGTEGAEAEIAARAHPVCGALNLYPDDLDVLVEKGPAILEVAEALGP